MRHFKALTSFSKRSLNQLRQMERTQVRKSLCLHSSCCTSGWTADTQVSADGEGKTSRGKMYLQRSDRRLWSKISPSVERNVGGTSVEKCEEEEASRLMVVAGSRRTGFRVPFRGSVLRMAPLVLTVLVLYNGLTTIKASNQVSKRHTQDQMVGIGQTSGAAPSRRLREPEPSVIALKKTLMENGPESAATALLSATNLRAGLPAVLQSLKTDLETTRNNWAECEKLKNKYLNVYAVSMSMLMYHVDFPFGIGLLTAAELPKGPPDRLNRDLLAETLSEMVDKYLTDLTRPLADVDPSGYYDMCINGPGSCRLHPPSLKSTSYPEKSSGPRDLVNTSEETRGLNPSSGSPPYTPHATGGAPPPYTPHATDGAPPPDTHDPQESPPQYTERAPEGHALPVHGLPQLPKYSEIEEQSSPHPPPPPYDGAPDPQRYDGLQLPRQYTVHPSRIKVLGACYHKNRPQADMSTTAGDGVVQTALGALQIFGDVDFGYDSKAVLAKCRDLPIGSVIINLRILEASENDEDKLGEASASLITRAIEFDPQHRMISTAVQAAAEYDKPPTAVLGSGPKTNLESLVSVMPTTTLPPAASEEGFDLKLSNDLNISFLLQIALPELRNKAKLLNSLNTISSNEEMFLDLFYHEVIEKELKRMRFGKSVKHLFHHSRLVHIGGLRKFPDSSSKTGTRVVHWGKSIDEHFTTEQRIEALVGALPVGSMLLRLTVVGLGPNVGIMPDSVKESATEPDSRGRAVQEEAKEEAVPGGGESDSRGGDDDRERQQTRPKRGGRRLKSTNELPVTAREAFSAIQVSLDKGNVLGPSSKIVYSEAVPDISLFAATPADPKPPATVIPWWLLLVCIMTPILIIAIILGIIWRLKRLSCGCMPRYGEEAGDMSKSAETISTVSTMARQDQDGSWLSHRWENVCRSMDAFVQKNLV